MYKNLTEKNRELLYKNNLVELEARAFSSQMNPHFVYNSLSAAQYLIMINENKKAFDYLSDFSLLLRQMFENAKKSHVSLTEEISFLKRYIELERLRFNNSFTYSMNLEKLDESRSYYIPTMMLQPVVENAIRHGLAPKKQNAELTIDFSVMNDLLICIIDDNGIGLKKNVYNYSGHEHSALKIISERIMLINETAGKKGYMRVIDKKAKGGEGLLVELALPIQNN